MMSLNNILIITKFESKVLWRNWFFRIFVLLELFLLTIFDVAAFSFASNSPQFIKGNSWGIPYANMLLMSIGQAAAIIFLATGTIIKNKKIDTNEVFFVRPISNADYVFGKAFSIFKLFFWLNIAVLILGLIFNLTNPLTQFNPLAYIFYPLLTSLPSIIFMTGFAFFLATILRNQPISIILLLGISAVVLIYFQGKYSNIFDFTAFRLNMMASDITGFSDLKSILLQRSFYLIAGITFLFGTVLFIDRLSNHKRNRYFLAIITLLFVACSTYIMLNLWSLRAESITLRKDMIALNSEWSEVPNIDVVSNHISLEQSGDEISCTSTLVTRNNSTKPIKTIYFTLNPGLEILDLTVDGSKAEFERNLHIVSITQRQEFEPGQEANVKITYHGNVIEDVAHLEVDQQRYEKIYSSFIYPIEKRYAFVQSGYVLLTKDVLWYPDTQIGYSRQSPIKEKKAFINFKLDVKVEAENTPISQGRRVKDSDGLYKFRSEYPLPQISLTIGSYEKKELSVDSVNYTIYHYKGNDYFSSYFDQIEDTLSFLITDLVNGYEHDQKLKYPFQQLQFVETPIQFNAYNKIYEDHQAYVQPEIVFWPEKGGDIRDFDFKRQFRKMDHQARKQNQVMSDKEKQANVFNNLVKKVFTKQTSRGSSFADKPNYSIFPNFYSYNSGIVSQDWPMLNKSVSNYLNKEQLTGNDVSRNRNGISFAEECNELMSNLTIMEILTQVDEFRKIQKSISLKGEYLFSYLDELIGEQAFKEFLYSWINNNQHRLTRYEDFRTAILNTFDLDIDPIIRQVYFDKDQPSFLIENIERYELIDGDKKRYQVLFDVKNTGNNHGVIKVSFKESESNTPEYLSVIKTGEIKQLGFLLDNQPKQITINTLVSKNIPSVITLASSKFDLRENVTPFEGERILNNNTDSQQYQIIVDNEDSGFSTFSPIKATYLKEFLDSRNPSDKKYYGRWGISYSKWLATTGSNFYGQHIRSAHFTRSGKGDKITEWKPKLNESGFYDLYVFMMGKNQNQFNGRNNKNRKYTYQYLINHGDGKDEISFNISNAERGWNYLGSYYFSQEGGSVVLTDQCDLRRVYADAVKWVKQ